MADDLIFGLLANDRRETVWVDDPAIDLEATSAEAIVACRDLGDVSGLVFRSGVRPQRLTYRPLTAVERAHVMERLGPTAQQAAEGIDKLVSFAESASA